MLYNLLQRVKKDDFTLGVVGLGRVGLPLAAVFASDGVNVIGFEKNEDIVDKANGGIPPFIEKGLEEHLKKAIEDDKFYATEDGRKMKKCDILLIAVGTPLTKNFQPDYTQIRSVLEEMVKYDVKDKLIILRSTSSPTTIEEIVQPFIEEKTGLKAGKDFGLAVCPERIAEGKAIEEITQLPEIIGGINHISSEIAAELFKKVNSDKRIIFMNPKAAALAKLFTNVYRYVNFALVNEFGLIAEKFGEDAFDIIKKCNLDYHRSNMPIPGLSGGPCLTKDGYHLTSDSIFPDFILMAWRLNESIPVHIVNKLKRELEKRGKKMMGTKIGVLGVGFKAGSDDLRFSPSLKIVEILQGSDADLFVHDPYVNEEEADKYGVKLSTLDDVINGTDAIILATNHPEFANLHKIIDENNPDCILIDSWGMFDPEDLKNVKYICFGRGNNI